MLEVQRKAVGSRKRVISSRDLLFLNDSEKYRTLFPSRQTHRAVLSLPKACCIPWNATYAVPIRVDVFKILQPSITR